MVDFKKAEQFRFSKEPFSTLWHAEGEEAYGSLSWRNGRANLSLCVSVPGIQNMRITESKIGILRVTKPTLQPTIFGRVSPYGTVTLRNCAQYNIRISHDFSTETTICHIDLLPAQVWIGSQLEDVEDHVFYVFVRDTRLNGYFGSPGLKTYHAWDAELKPVFDALGSPDEVWALQNLREPNIALKGTPFSLTVSSDVYNSFSATEGHSLQSLVKLTLRSEEPITVGQAADVLYQLEQIFSVFALEPFSFQFKEFHGKEGLPNSVYLVWQLGENRESFHPPMRQQILVDLTDRHTLETICNSWFGASQIIKLSRWLFTRALRETDNGLARFIAVAQAFEVLGRELVASSKMPKSRMKRAVEIVHQGLGKEFDTEFVERVISLIRSSNKTSYRDVLYAMLSAANPEPQHDLLDFCKRVSDTRNAVVHMTTSSEAALNDAFRSVNKLSLQICFWYAVVQAHHLKVPIPNIAQFLFSNRNARHGLPNEVLERDN